MTMPNFLIIGATKSGTTSLYHYLGQHPEIYLSPIKETNFFAYEGETIDFRWWGEPPRTTLESITDLEDYRRLFAAAAGETRIGEISPYYLYNERAPERIYHHIPHAKLIAILRHPAERAYSNYMHLIRDGREPCPTFAEALAQEPHRRQENWAWDYYYEDMGYYGHQLQRYYDRFPAEQIRVFRFDDLAADPQATLQAMFAFLGVDTSFQPRTSFRDNVSGIPRSRALQRFVDQPNLLKPLIRRLLPEWVRQAAATRLRQLNLDRPSLDPALRRDLTRRYEADVRLVESLTDLDLRHWLAS